MTLPRYSPPMTLSASVAAGLAPLAVLLAFVLIVTRVIDVDTGLAVFAACALWVAAEMHGYCRFPFKLSLSIFHVVTNPVT